MIFNFIQLLVFFPNTTFFPKYLSNDEMLCVIFSSAKLAAQWPIASKLLLLRNNKQTEMVMMSKHLRHSACKCNMFLTIENSLFCF